MTSEAAQRLIDEYGRDDAFMRDVRRAVEDAAPADRAEVFSTAARLAKEDDLEAVEKLRLSLLPRRAPRFHEGEGNLIPLDHEVLVEVREALAEAESTEERYEIVNAVTDALASRPDWDGDSGLVNAVLSEGLPFGLFGDSEHDVTRDEPPTSIPESIAAALTDDAIERDEQALMAAALVTEEELALPGSVRKARGAAALLEAAMSSATGEAEFGGTDA